MFKVRSDWPDQAQTVAAGVPLRALRTRSGPRSQRGKERACQGKGHRLMLRKTGADCAVGVLPVRVIPGAMASASREPRECGRHSGDVVSGACARGRHMLALDDLGCVGVGRVRAWTSPAPEPLPSNRIRRARARVDVTVSRPGGGCRRASRPCARGRHNHRHPCTGRKHVAPVRAWTSLLDFGLHDRRDGRARARVDVTTAQLSDHQPERLRPCARGRHVSSPVWRHWCTRESGLSVMTHD